MTTSDNNLKLIAIRTLPDCSSKYRRKLAPDTLYQFLQNYQFVRNDKDEIISIDADRELDRLYNQLNEETNDIVLNISAVVGENGSGKSSLVELLYLGIYVLSVEKGLLTRDQERIMYRRLDAEYSEIKAGLRFELYYEIDKQFVCLRFNDGLFWRESSGNVDIHNVFQGESPNVDALFYSIVINYSLYGLNERSSGYWLSTIFHKNDGYRTPIVINPFRDWGKIDILSEAHLAQSRLLANLKPDQKETFEILTNRTINYVRLDASFERTERLDRTPMRDIINGLIEDLQLQEEEIFSRIYKTILKTKTLPEQLEKIKYRRLLETYVIKKVVKICKNYKEYRDRFYIPRRDGLPSIENFSGYLEALAKDPSHITLKLRQALNTYKENMLREDRERGVKRREGGLSFPIQELSRRVAEAHAAFPERELVEFIPAAMLKPTIVLDDGSNFISLSSGEQQFVHSMQSVLYHLNNLNSAFAAKDERVTYNHVNVVLDEIELYFHPEFQRRYVFELMENIRKMYIPNIKSVNIMFLTHSPFILSDIPKDNILKLKQGGVEPQMENTFAGNIHTMLADSFFMKSTLGEFAKQQLTAIVDFHDEVRRTEKEDLTVLREAYRVKRPIFKLLVKNIGEDVLVGALGNHLAYIDKKLGFQELDFQGERKRLLEIRKQIDEELSKLGHDQD